MKEFEKWFDKNMMPHARRREFVPKSGYKRGWRAALEWAESQEAGCMECGQTISYVAIEQELKEN